MENKAISIVSLLSMIFGIVGVFISIGGVGILFDIPAIVLAVIALVKKFNNKGMAIAGLATGSAGIIIFILLIVAAISVGGSKKDVSDEALFLSEREVNDIYYTGNIEPYIGRKITKTLEVYRENEYEDSQVYIFGCTYKGENGFDGSTCIRYKDENFKCNIEDMIEVTGTIVGVSSVAYDEKYLVIDADEVRVIQDVEKDDGVKTETETEKNTEVANEEPLSIAEQTIYDENGILMKITGLEEKYGNYYINVYIENNSEWNLGFNAHSYAVNGIMTRNNIYDMDCDVAVGKKANTSINIDNSFLDDYEIETIKNINVLFWAYDNDGLMKELDTGQIMISTSADDGTYDTISGQNVYDDEKISVDYLYCDGDEYFYCLTNKTDEYFNFDVDNTSVNDFTMSGIDYDLYDEQVLSGCQIVYSIKVGSGFLEDNGLDAVRKIEYNFKIRTREDWFSEYSTGTVCHEL